MRQVNSNSLAAGLLSDGLCTSLSNKGANKSKFRTFTLANPVFGAILAGTDTHAGLAIECGGIALAKDSGTKVEVVSSVLASKSGRNMLGAARIIVMRVDAVGASGDDMATSGSRIWSPWSVTTDSIAAVACLGEPAK